MTVNRKVAGGIVAVLLVAAAAVVALGREGDDDPRSRRGPVSVVEGSVLRPAAGAGGSPVDGRAGDLAWRVGDGELVVLRDDRMILRAADPGRFESVTVEAADLDGDGAHDLVAGFRGSGSGGLLEIDVVSSGGDVVLHQELDKGIAVLGPFGLDVYAARFDPDDPNCCPSRYQKRTVSGGPHAWTVEVAGTVEAASVPDGEF